MSLPVVAVIGRPNVGKSTLFNRITKSRAAVVHEDSGVTRDRHVHPAEWNGIPFLLVDTGGLTPIAEGALFEDEISSIAREAIASADLLLMLADVHTGITATDEAIASELRGCKQPLLLVVNKCEKDSDQLEASRFHRLGLGDPFPISALHGIGVADMLDRLCEEMPRRKPEPVDDLRVAIIGRPNVGKSSLLNALMGENRTLVSELPGTTRDAIDSVIRWHGKSIRLIDTAGIRRRVKHVKGVEYFSTLRSLQAVRRAEVVILLLDADAGIVAQDAHVAGEIHEAGRGCIVAWNKWDTVAKDDRSYLEYEQKVRDDLSFLSYAPIVTISALDGQRVPRLLELAWKIAEEARKSVETSRLNDILGKAIQKNPPKVHNRGVGKLFYATQTGHSPPAFTLFVNRPEVFARNYLRYLNNQIREACGFEGTRIRLHLRGRQ
jgi:GTP-binding protein